MISLEQQVCSLELSRRLKELGVRQESYFKWVGYQLWDETQQSDYETTSTPSRDEWYAAFTVAELGEMLPKEINQYLLQMAPPFHRAGDRWVLWYEDADSDDKMWLGNGPDKVCSVSAATEADARAKMLIYLVENKLVTPKA